MKLPEVEILTKQDLDGLKERIGSADLPASDIALIIGLIAAVLWLVEELRKKRLSIRRLMRLFGIKSEKARDVLKGLGGKKGGKNKDGVKSGGKNAGKSEKSGPSGENKNGHGHRSASDFSGAVAAPCLHDALATGTACRDELCGGRLNALPPGKFIHVIGQAPFSATLFEQEKLRCNLCGKTYTAPLPDGIEGRYDITASAMTAVLRYGFGLPHYRQEKLQDCAGVPISDSSFFDMSETVADAGVKVHQHLVYLAGQAHLIHPDDTKTRIQEFRGYEENGRTGLFSTAIIAFYKLFQIALFFTGKNYAGENMDKILQHRAKDLGPPIQMCDAHNKINLPKKYGVILANCLTHGRRQFIDIRQDYPEECKHVILEIGKIYENDRLSEGMADDERLRFHQDCSKKIMDDLQSWYKSQLEDKKVEPSSNLGKAFNYLENHWHALTQFLRIPGCPLANDIVERLIKSYALHRKNSLHYRTQHGALIGDILMSLIQTAIRAQVDPFHYLTELQRYKSKAHQNPEAWLPWNYLQTISAIKSDAA